MRDLLEKCIHARAARLVEPHLNALRLFNGFTEGCPDLAVDIYARTLVIHNYAAVPQDGHPLALQVSELLREVLPWLQAGVLKDRNGDAPGRVGRLLFGEKAAVKASEAGVWYALDLLMHQDASLYLDTHLLRAWATENLQGKRVLNTFAYTGSLGAAAYAGGAAWVVQTDLDRRFLDLAKQTYALNGFPVRREDFIQGDFFTVVSRLKRTGELFDCVFLDPPFFAVNSRARIDLNRDSGRLVNKVRPLVTDGGWLVAVNNAVYVSGEAYLRLLETLCQDGYMEIAALIPVAEDFTGYPETRTGAWAVDPAPFNHSTKIAVLKVRRKG